MQVLGQGSAPGGCARRRWPRHCRRRAAPRGPPRSSTAGRFRCRWPGAAAARPAPHVLPAPSVCAAQALTPLEACVCASCAETACRAHISEQLVDRQCQDRHWRPLVGCHHSQTEHVTLCSQADQAGQAARGVRQTVRRCLGQGRVGRDSSGVPGGCRRWRARRGPPPRRARLGARRAARR